MLSSNNTVSPAFNSSLFQVEINLVVLVLLPNLCISLLAALPNELSTIVESV